MSRNVGFTYNERDKYDFLVATSDNPTLRNPSGMVTKSPYVHIKGDDRQGNKVINATFRNFDPKTRDVFFSVGVAPDSTPQGYTTYIDDDYNRANQVVFKYLDNIKDANIRVETAGSVGYFPTNIHTTSSTIKITLQALGKGDFPDDSQTVNVENPCSVYTIGRSADNKLTVEADTGRPKSVCTNAMLGRS